MQPSDMKDQVECENANFQGRMTNSALGTLNNGLRELILRVK